MMVPWIVLTGLIAAGIFARGFFWNNAVHNAEDYYQYIYYSSLGRFDELLPGVALALLKNYHQAIWARCMQSGNLFLGLGSLASGVHALSVC